MIISVGQLGLVQDITLHAIGILVRVIVTDISWYYIIYFGIKKKYI